jgi:predicted Zn-dependent protease
MGHNAALCGVIAAMVRPLLNGLLALVLAVLAAPLVQAEVNHGLPPPASSVPDIPASRPSTQSVQGSLPDLGSSANSILSRADEYQIGRVMMRDLRSQNAVLDDPEASDYLQSVGSRIAVEAQEGQQQFTFFAVRDQSINAFALPGGFIGVNTGLILLTTSESELAGVMAHEIGHVVQRHIARAVEAQSRSSIATMATMLGAVLIGAVTGNANALPGIIAAGQGVAMQQQINFTRGEETEADRVGIGFMAAAGFDPNGMVGFFATMMRERGVGADDIPMFLVDHPADTKRVAEARARVNSLSGYARRPDSATYPYMRERLRVISGPGETDLRRYYEHQRQADPDSRALRYGAALAELKSGDPVVAVDLLKPLVDAQPGLPLLYGALGQAQMAAGRDRDARATFEQALALSPRNVPLSVRYAEALLKLGDARKAHALLLDLFNNVMPTPEQIRLTAIAANSAGDTADAYYYMGELHIATGDLSIAGTQLELALATPGLTEVQRKRFQARLDEVRGWMREMQGNRASRGQPPG